MEAAGVRVDKEQLKEYGDHLKVRIVKLEQEIYELAGEQFNTVSYTHLVASIGSVTTMVLCSIGVGSLQ